MYTVMYIQTLFIYWKIDTNIYKSEYSTLQDIHDMKYYGVIKIHAWKLYLMTQEMLHEVMSS